ncbi:PREDICTED: LOW QUALITY PROTEIN: putative tripartite motif-containing protein 64C, partial [Chinchilla lanigera]|uniref:LOW QUALITY PROTEIN: putative tripartite motif-containing protein 64C n=1 Tax=Chinchilla lanigera TaxID=34839 RepID=UPI000697AEAC
MQNLGDLRVVCERGVCKTHLPARDPFRPRVQAEDERSAEKYRHRVCTSAAAQPVHPELISWYIAALQEMLTKFQVNNGMVQGWPSHWVHMSKRAEHIRREDHDGAPTEPWIMENFGSVCTEAFTSGQHYWEGDTAHPSSWIVFVEIL